ncbi:MAG TPA: hypothetical protein PLN88_03940 [Candidatus Cloacimonadota bacterium]|nr:hypothetical protein [Candidatus Cloacimonadota bacterium]
MPDFVKKKQFEWRVSATCPYFCSKLVLSCFACIVMTAFFSRMEFKSFSRLKIATRHVGSWTPCGN